MWTGEHKGRERGRGGWRGGDNGSRYHVDSGIVWDLFCCLVFLFPSSFPLILQVQKRKESWHSALVWGSQENDRIHPFTAATSVWWFFLCLCVHPWVPGNSQNFISSRAKSVMTLEIFSPVPVLLLVSLISRIYSVCFYSILYSSHFSSPWMDCIDSQFVLNLAGKQWWGQDSSKTAGVGMFVDVSSPVLEAPLKCQLSVCKRETTSMINPESPHSLFTVSPSNRSEPRATAQSSMPLLIIRPHQRLFGLSNQCLLNGMPSLQETTNEYFITPLI